MAFDAGQLAAHFDIKVQLCTLGGRPLGEPATYKATVPIRVETQQKPDDDYEGT